MITQERLKELFTYSKKTGVFKWKKGGHGITVGSIAGCPDKAISGKTYLRIGVDRRVYRAHRLAYLYVMGEHPDGSMDHQNGDGTDNRWENIRPCTHLENSKNKRLHANNTSGFCGVSFDKTTERWVASIRVGGVNHFLGSFEKKSHAVEVRQIANMEYGFHDNHGTKRPL